MMRLDKLRLQLAILFVFCLGQFAQAQSDPTGQSAVTGTFALTNATVITAPGASITDATVVVKDGLIFNVGQNVSIPNNAEVIDATGLFVYPAFIDGMANTGAKRPESVERPRNLFTPDPPNDFAGITPENSVLSQLDPSSGTIKSMRKAGFAISHTVPYGRMLPGSSSLILLKDGTHADDIMMAENVALYAQWVGAPGAYPNNILGMMAKWRNLYRNAVLNKKHADMYAEDPSGLARPTSDRVSQAFYPVVTKDMPVIFDVSGMLDVRRAMRLQNDLGFNLMVSGLDQSFELVDELKATATPVFLSLDMPDAPKDSKNEDKSEEVKALEARRMEFYTKHIGQAAALEQAGIKFGFTTKGAKTNKLKDNMMTMIENGLSEDAALAALTTNPAQMLGISQVSGSIASGKIANLMVTTAPYFTKESQIKMMFVDGDKFEYETKDKKKKSEGDEPAAVDPSNDPIIGSWSFSFVTPQGEQTGKMVIKASADGYEGVLISEDGSPDNDMNNLSYRDGELAFDFSIEGGGQSIEIVVVGTVTGKEYVAEASVAAFNVSFELTATKDE